MQAAPYLTIAGSGLQPAEVRTAQNAAALATRWTAMHWPGCALALASAVAAGCTVCAGAGKAVPLRSALMGTWRPSAEDCPPPAGGGYPKSSNRWWFGNRWRGFSRLVATNLCSVG